MSFTRGRGSTRRILASRLERRSGQARQKIFRPHIGQEVVGADRVAGDARNDATVGPRQHVDQHRASRRLLHALALEDELAVLVDQAGGMPFETSVAIGIAGGDADILPGEGEHEQRKQRILLDRGAPERFVQRIVHLAIAIKIHRGVVGFAGLATRAASPAVSAGPIR